MRNTVIILDFGGQYNQLIARRVREQHVYCELLPCDASYERVMSYEPKGIIYTGGPQNVYAEDALRCDRRILESGIPQLGMLRYADARC